MHQYFNLTHQQCGCSGQLFEGYRDAAKSGSDTQSSRLHEPSLADPWILQYSTSKIWK